MLVEAVEVLPLSVGLVVEVWLMVVVVDWEMNKEQLLMVEELATVQVRACEEKRNVVE